MRFSWKCVRYVIYDAVVDVNQLHFNGHQQQYWKMCRLKDYFILNWRLRRSSRPRRIDYEFQSSRHKPKISEMRCNAAVLLLSWAPFPPAHARPRRVHAAVQEQTFYEHIVLNVKNALRWNPIHPKFAFFGLFQLEMRDFVHKCQKFRDLHVTVGNYAKKTNAINCKHNLVFLFSKTFVFKWFWW
jgi:hypothetical protein